MNIDIQLTPEKFVEYLILGMRDSGKNLLDFLIDEMDYFLASKFPKSNFNCTTFYGHYGVKALENQFEIYLSNWGLDDKMKTFYLDIFMGRRENFYLTHIQK